MQACTSLVLQYSWPQVAERSSSTKASVAETNWASTELMEVIEAMPHLEDLIYSFTEQLPFGLRS